MALPLFPKYHRLVIPFSGWAAAEWSAFGTMIVAVGGVGSILWAVLTYRNTKRSESARWMDGLFREFYLDPRFRKVKQALQYDYASKLAPLIERRLTNRDMPTSALDRQLLEDLDVLLNYFEQLLYLEHVGQIPRADCRAFFDYWFKLLAEDGQAALRRYIAVFNYEKLASELNETSEEYLALYGTLMSGLRPGGKEAVFTNFDCRKDCQIVGALYDTGNGYPALTGEPGITLGEVYRLIPHLPSMEAQRVFQPLDEFEKYYPSDPEGSLYLRRAVRLADPPVDAWVYVYNREIGEMNKIDSGDWRSHRKATKP